MTFATLGGALRDMTVKRLCWRMCSTISLSWSSTSEKCSCMHCAKSCSCKGPLLAQMPRKAWRSKMFWSQLLCSALRVTHA